MRRAYSKLTGSSDSFQDVRYKSKRLIMETSMASELNVLAHALERIAEGNRRSRDFTLDSLRDALAEVIACFPVYRTYVDEDGWTPEDRAVVEQAIARARRRNPAMEASLFDFFREVMLPGGPESTGSSPGHESRPGDRRTGYPPADAAEAAVPAAVRDEVPAVHGAGAGQGARGHGVFSLQPAAVAQRSWRRCRAFRPRSRGLPRVERRRGFAIVHSS